MLDFFFFLGLLGNCIVSQVLDVGGAKWAAGIKRNGPHHSELYRLCHYHCQYSTD